MTQEQVDQPRRGLLRSIGPAIIIASVVLGPGSILTSSKVGVEHGYSMVWVLVAASALMVCMTALGARLGVVLKQTPCEEIAQRVGRPAAAFVGLMVFLICACFQFSNNIGVVASIDPLLRGVELFEGDAEASENARKWMSIAALVVLNLVIIATLFGLKTIYKHIEKLMMLLVLLMMIGFLVNLYFAKPSPVGVLQGLVPKLPAGELGESVLPLLGMIATTFSVAAAFFQAYLVREKGWTTQHLRQGLTDSIAGISVLGGITLVIMATSAAVLHGKVDPASLTSAGDVALQLEPLFGRFAMVLFCLGIFAGAFSSFLVNAMVGGALLADGLGMGGRLDDRGAKIGTVLALAAGLAVAALVYTMGKESVVNLIIFAQALTVTGVPVLAIAMVYLATRPDLTGVRRVPLWIKITGGIGLLVTIALAVRTAISVLGKLGVM